MSRLADWWNRPVEYTPEDMAAYREARPDSAPYPDVVVASTMVFAWFVLHRRLLDVWEVLKTTPLIRFLLRISAPRSDRD